MRIVYDLRYACDHFVGIATHAHALLQALLDLPGDERYVVLWNPAFAYHTGDLDALRAHRRVEWVETRIPTLSVAAAWALGRLVRDLRADVYLSPYYLVPRGAGCPCAITLHDVRPLVHPQDFPLRSRVLFRGAMLDAARAAAVLTVSAFSREEILRHTRLSPRAVRAVLSGVPPAPALAPVRPAGVPEGRFALFLGSNRPHKNLAHLAQVWAAFGGTSPLALVMAGPEDARFPRLADLAAAAGARDVYALGRVGDDEKEWLLGHAEMLVFPTLYEGVGLPLAEALAHGMPAVTSDIPALREMAEGAAWHLPPHDVGAWVAAIRALAEDGATRARWREAARARAPQLSFATTARGVLDIVRELGPRAGEEKRAS